MGWRMRGGGWGSGGGGGGSGGGGVKMRGEGPTLTWLPLRSVFRSVFWEQGINS